MMKDSMVDVIFRTDCKCCEIQGSHGGADEDSSLQGCLAVSNGERLLNCQTRTTLPSAESGSPIRATVYQPEYRNIPDNLNLHHTS